VADGGGQDGLSGMHAGEQPRAGSAGGDLAEVAAVAGEVVEVAGQGFGDADRGGAQRQRGALGVEADVAGGEAGDAAGALAEQQDEQPGDRAEMAGAISASGTRQPSTSCTNRHRNRQVGGPTDIFSGPLQGACRDPVKLSFQRRLVVI
jgi:hypothetical protein